jgi:hypothetical protein
VTFFLLMTAIALACSNTTSRPDSTQTLKESTSKSEKQEANPQTPNATQRVYSPLVGSGKTPSASPTVKISVDPVSLRGGQMMTVTVTVDNISSPTYLLFVRDQGVTNVPKTIGVTDENILIPGTSNSQVLEPVSAHGGSNQAVFTLRALLDGSTEVWASVIAGGATAGASAGWVSETVQVKVGK